MEAVDKSERDPLELIYNRRFSAIAEYRQNVWKILCGDFFSKYIKPTDTVLDLGCGWGEFINTIDAKKKFAMDLNPEAADHLDSSVTFLQQDCSANWGLESNSLDVVFSSNFLEHLPSKAHLRETFKQIQRCLKPGGKVICLGPNIRFLRGRYWDFFDHYVALSELSLKELMEISGFKCEECVPRFLPYTMSDRQPPLLFLKLYLKMPLAWPLFGKQFLVVGKKSG